MVLMVVGVSHMAPSTMCEISEEDWRVRSKPTVCFGRFRLVRIPGLGKLTRMHVLKALGKGDRVKQAS